MMFNTPIASLFAVVLAMSSVSVHASQRQLVKRDDGYKAAGKSDGPEADGTHEIRFTLKGCPATVKPKLSGTSSAGTGNFVAKPPGSITVPSDFIGSVFLTGEGCGRYGDACQSVELTFKSNPTDTVRSYINYDALSYKRFVYPVRARFDDNNDPSDAASIDCDNYECLDGARDPDDFISNRIYSSTRGVGVDIVYDCSANATATA